MKQRRVLLWSALLFGLLLAATCVHRQIWVDEPWFGEQAASLAREGRVRSELFRGLGLGWEERVLVYHKLYIWLAALYAKLLGSPLAALRWASGTSAAALAALLFAHERRRRPLLALLLALGSGLLVKYGFIGRPEALAAVCGFASFWLLEEGRAGASGLCAGLAVLAHLNGLAFVFAGAVTLLLRKRLGAVVLFAGCAAAVAALYPLEAVLFADLRTLAFQLRNDPGVVTAFDLRAKLKDLMDADRVLFHDLPAASATTLFVGCAVVWLAGIRQRAPLTLRYAAWLTVAMALLQNRTSPHYLVLFLPLVLVFACETLASAAGRWRRATAVLLVLYLAGGLGYAARTLMLNREPTAVEESRAVLARLTKPSGRLIAPMVFFFEGAPRYRVMGLHRFDHHDRRTGRFPGFDGLFAVARDEDVDAVILDRLEARGFQYLHLPEPLPAAMPGYALSSDDGRFAVYSHVAVPTAPRRSPPPSLRRPV